MRERPLGPGGPRIRWHDLPRSGHRMAWEHPAGLAEALGRALEG